MCFKHHQHLFPSHHHQSSSLAVVYSSTSSHHHLHTTTTTTITTHHRTKEPRQETKPHHHPPRTKNQDNNLNHHHHPPRHAPTPSASSSTSPKTMILEISFQHISFTYTPATAGGTRLHPECELQPPLPFSERAAPATTSPCSPRRPSSPLLPSPPWTPAKHTLRVSLCEARGCRWDGHAHLWPIKLCRSTSWWKGPRRRTTGR